MNKEQSTCVDLCRDVSYLLLLGRVSYKYIDFTSLNFVLIILAEMTEMHEYLPPC